MPIASGVVRATWTTPVIAVTSIAARSVVSSMPAAAWMLRISWIWAARVATISSRRSGRRVDSRNSSSIAGAGSG